MTLLPAPDRIPINRAIGVLPSRAASNLFWLGRYSERCEAKARLVRATLAMRTNEAVWRRAREQCILHGVLPREGDPSVTVFDDAHEFGLAADLGRLGWCATQSRSRLVVTAIALGLGATLAPSRLVGPAAAALVAVANTIE